MLNIKNLSISFLQNKKFEAAVDDVSFSLHQNEILGMVGESGSGKSITSLALLGLLPKGIARVDGTIFYNEENITTYSEKAFQKIRGRKIAMIFQEPMSSLNPTLTCGYQVAEILQQHTQLSKSEIYAAVIALFEKVKLPRATSIFKAYPHQISGGQKQRVMIAMAIACKPEILIADEPTTALDVTVQKEIILLLKELQLEYGMSILFITHDLALVSEIADRVVVMYKGSLVEQGSTKEVFLNPQKNYTKALINAKPNLERRLHTLPTVRDFIEETFDSSVYTKAERARFHEKIYQKSPLLEIRNLKKEFITKGAWFQKDQTNR